MSTVTAGTGTGTPATPADPHHIWISKHDDDHVSAAVAAATGPLAGVTVAVKDNVDVVGLPTTAACRSFAYQPGRTAPAVQRLVDAGAVVVGKTNLDQFATGLVGTRSPYGAVESPVAPGRVSGGSSSGSAAAVAAGAVDIAVGTDTAGSGRVPAAFCGIVGLKGTRGWVPTAGVVPACPSFDCTTVFARSVSDAARALRTMAGTDADDPSSRARPTTPTTAVRRMGVPTGEVLADCDDRTRQHFATAVELAAALGYDMIEIDLAAYLEAGALLYGGAFVAERTAAFGHALGDDADPAVAAIVTGGSSWSAVDLAADRARLDGLRVRAAAVWTAVDAVLVPTAPFHPTLAEVDAEPFAVNARLGRFVSGCNLVDWCAAAIPVPTDDGLPFGVQLLGPAWSDPAIWVAAARMLGEDADGIATADVQPHGSLQLAVVGAHLAGEPLNHQLTDRGGSLARRTTTAARYRMVALPGPVAKPGLVHVGPGGGAVEVEVWSLPAAGFGHFVAAVFAPLSIGAVELADKTSVPGFLCDGLVAAEAPDITSWGGWRAWKAHS
jgi:allophanate hydrolase